MAISVKRYFASSFATSNDLFGKRVGAARNRSGDGEGLQEILINYTEK